MGFVWFASGFDDCPYSEKSEDAAAVARTLSDAFAIVDAKHVEFAPLDFAAIRQKAPRFANTAEFIEHIKGLKPSTLADALSPFLKWTPPQDVSAKKLTDPADVTAAVYLHYAFRSIYPHGLPKGTAPGQKEVRLAANFDGWVAVKKVSLSAEPKEVFAALCSMRAVLERKTLEFGTPGFEAFAEKMETALSAFPERKSFGKLPAALSSVQGLTENRAWQEYADATAMKRAGYPPYLSVDHAIGLYPDLKIPKPKGNFGGKKKK